MYTRLFQFWGCVMTRLSPVARQALREIVREYLKANGLGRDMTEDQAVSAAIELIEAGLVRIESDGERYRMVSS